MTTPAPEEDSSQITIGGSITAPRLGRLLTAWAGALHAGSLTPAEVAYGLADLGNDLIHGRVVIEGQSNGATL